MNTIENSKTPWHLWAVGIIGVLWNSIGANDYTQTQLGNRDYFEAMGFDPATTEATLEMLSAAPMWADAGWALGVWGAVVGSILVLFRSRWAVTAFILSLVGLAVSTVYQFTVEMPPEVAEMQNSAMYFVIWGIAIFLLWYAMRMRGQGVLR